MTPISTPYGDIKLLPPPDELLGNISYFMPFGFASFDGPDEDGASFGLVMQCGDQELYAVKLQPPDYEKEAGEHWYQVNNMLIVHSLAAYLTQDFSGLFLPCVYIRDKGTGRVESGIALFGYPWSEGRECESDQPSEAVFDERLGHGFTAMMLGFLDAHKQSVQNLGIEPQRFVGIDIRPRLQLGTLGLNLMVVGPHIVHLKRTVTKEDTTWKTIRGAGITEVFHVPSVPLAINEEALPPAKKADAAALAERFSPRFEEQRIKAREEAKAEADRKRREAVNRSNEIARTMAGELGAEGLMCPHCRKRSREIRFVDKSPEAQAYFICKLCGRSFVPEE